MSEYVAETGAYSLIDPQLLHRPSLAILGTCKCLYRDTASYFYSKNAFHFDQFEQGHRSKDVNSSIRVALAFLEDRPSCVLGWIENITIAFGNGQNSETGSPREFLYQCVPPEEAERLYKILQDRIELKRLSILIRGWPLDVRPGKVRFDYRPDSNDLHRRQRGVDPWKLNRVRIGLKHLLSLCNVSRLSVEIHASPPPSSHVKLQRDSLDPGRLVAVAALLRSHRSRVAKL
ncbi:hypothetical protein IWX90DRAFT_417356 [Phyllosticta citrichinensis]|uniref:Uncharacterized protein n=1 Tax=Phyllosticta citrichinensis TaxID=1130410 RepID=A0ABR1XKP2_9PEZI